jgi:hypothetical protein
MKKTKKTAEESLASALNERNILFTPQHRVFAEMVGSGPGLRDRLAKSGYKDWRLDFSFPDKIFIEVQGHGYGHSGKGAIRDWQKHNALVLLGWRGLYFPAFTVQDRPDFVIEILEKLRGSR